MPLKQRCASTSCRADLPRVPRLPHLRRLSVNHVVPLTWRMFFHVIFETSPPRNAKAHCR